VPRVDPIQTRARRHKQKEEQLIELLGEPVKDDKFKLRWVASGLMYFHNVPKRESTKMAISALLIKELQVFAITWNDEYFTVPGRPPCAPVPRITGGTAED
jgi:hypothetical protein